MVSAFISTLANVIGPLLAPIIQAYFCKYFIRENETIPVTVRDDRFIRINMAPQIGTPEGIQTVPTKRALTDLKEIIGKLGPWGDINEGNPFNHNNGYDGIKTIKFGCDSQRIVSLEVQYTKDGELVWTPKVGGHTDDVEEIVLEDGEYITKVRGHHDSSYGIGMISSLAFLTDRGKEIGPYGSNGGTFFHTGRGKGRIIGFHGTAGKFISSFGIYVSPLPVRLI